MDNIGFDVIKRVQNTFKEDRTIFINKSIGKGAFGQCFDVTLSWNTSTNNRYGLSQRESCRKALKFIPGEIYRSKRELFDQEIITHKQLSHQYIVQLHQVNIDPLLNDVHMIMELCENGSLSDYVAKYGPGGNLSSDQSNRIAAGICKGLRYLHDCHKIVHRDIKPANILLNHKMYPKISDFGLATTLAQCRSNTSKICGTPHYLAPEIFQQKGHSFQSDIWAVGVTLFHMVSGYTPFEEAANNKFTKQHNHPITTQQTHSNNNNNNNNSLHHTISRVYRNVMTGRYKFPKITPESSKSYIKMILHKDPDQRPSLAQLLELKFCDNTECPETPDEDRRGYITSEVRVSLDSFTFISDQPVLDAIETLASRLVQMSTNKNPSHIVWVDRWGMSSIHQLYYTLNTGAYGGNLRSVKGILLGPKSDPNHSKQTETHFQNNDMTLTTCLAEQFEKLTKKEVENYCSVIMEILQKYQIPTHILHSFYSTIYSSSNYVQKQIKTTRDVFVFKWSFHADCIIFLLSNGVWQIGLKDHTKLLVYSKWTLLYNGESGCFDVVTIDEWCRHNNERLDIIRTLLYSIL